MKITPFIFVSTLLFGLLASLGFWTWTVTHTFQLTDPWLHSLLVALLHTFSDVNLRTVALWSLAKGLVPAVAMLYFLNDLDDSNRNGRVIRGATVVNSETLAQMTRSKRNNQIEIAGVPMPVRCETSHMLLVGSTGAGKSTALNELMTCALARGDRAIVIDPNGHSFARFGRNDDTVLNPFDKRSPGWSIFNEFRKPYDFARFAKSVIPDTGDSSAQQWHGYAQQLFSETARALTQTGETNTERLLFWLTQASAADLKVLLAGSAASGLFEPGAEKALASTRFILSHHLGAFQYLQPGGFSLRQWLEAGTGNLYITWREDMLTTLHPLVSAWTDILIASILTLPDDSPRPLWLILDELASLGRLNSLEAAMTRSRKHGLRVVACLQAVSQLSSIYGGDLANTLRSNFKNLLALGCSNNDATTAKEISDGLASCEVERLQTTINKGQGGSTTSTAKQITPRIAVLPAELMSLNALTGFLKFSGDYPIGRIRLVHRQLPVRLKPFVER